MLIVADENMPLVAEFFGDLGEIRRVSGRHMAAADVAGADLLLVRSVTRVDAGLLAGSRVRFVGSATIGTDHVDLDWLRRQGIAFSAAPGCNARAVAEYVATVLALHAEREGADLAACRLGIVGLGHVGRQVLALAQALGLACAVHDPLLLPADRAGLASLSLPELLDWADIITLHVPLTTGGPAPTRHLLDGDRLASGRWRLLVNTARGPVVDNRALSAALAARPDRQVVLDVWEDEPAVPPALLARAWLGTPHIAGYSQEGKWRGTAAVRAAAATMLDLAEGPALPALLAAAGDAPRDLAWAGSLAATLAACCPVPGDDARLRAVVVADAWQTAQAFDRLRRDYPERREFSHYRISKTPPAVRGLLAALGFAVAD